VQRKVGQVKPYIGPSDSQANAEALARRQSPHAASYMQTRGSRWDWRQRDPSDLREAVRMVRAAYGDEVPTKLHEGPDSIGNDGTPRMTAKAEGYIFGSPQGSDSTTPDDLVSYYHSPFRAHLASYARGGEGQRNRAAIVTHIAIGHQGPQESAIAVGVPAWCAKLVAEDVLRAFLRSMSDLKVHVD